MSKRTKKTKEKIRDKHDEELASDSEASIYSSYSANISAMKDDISIRNDNIDKIFELLDSLQEKRASFRVDSLKRIILILRNQTTDVVECVSQGRDIFKEHCIRILRCPASDDEGLLALDIFSIVCLALGPEENAFVASFSPILRCIAQSSPCGRFRDTSVFSLAFSSLICSSPTDDLGDWDFIEDILCAETEDIAPSSFQAAAMSSWCLLASASGASEIIERSQSRVFEVVVDLLCNGEDIQTRIEAGVCLALLWEAADEVNPGLEAEQSGAALCADGNTVHLALCTLKELARESSKRVSKRDRKELRSALRAVEAWTINGEKPRDEVQLDGASVECSDFRRIAQLDALREVLKDAFPAAARLFPVVREMLRITQMQEANTDRDGKGKNSSESRTRTTQRKQDRRCRDNLKNSSVENSEWDGCN